MTHSCSAAANSCEAGPRRLTVLLVVLAVMVALAGYKLLAMSSAFAVTRVG